MLHVVENFAKFQHQNKLCDLEFWVHGHSRSLKKVTFDR